MSLRNYYDSSSYGRNRDTGRIKPTSIAERPTSVTAKYTTTPSYKSSSIPVLNSDRNAVEKESPITAIANKYANYHKSESGTSKYEKKDYSKLSIPTITSTKSRDPSPVSTSSKYGLGRTSRHLSPDRRISKSHKEKSRDSSPGDRDIPSKSDKSTGYSSLSSYKLYPRSSSYTRPASRTETKPEVTINRYPISNRLSSNYLKSPPTVKRTSVSPVNVAQIANRELEKPTSPLRQVIQEMPKMENETVNEEKENKRSQINYDENETETITIITRHTSPTPPGSSAYLRTRRADMAKTVEKTVTRLRKKPEMVDKEIQSDRLDDSTRSNRLASTTRSSANNWSLYTPSTNSYTGYAGRYSTQYLNVRENSNRSSFERSSRSRSTEPHPKETSSSPQYSDNQNDKIQMVNDSNSEIVEAVYEETKGDDPSEIIINVNLKLKRAKSPVESTELVSPEITITNSQLPPQAPKTEGAVKTKKIKSRKTSTDSSSDSGSKKKIVKKRSKSVSSTDSDQASEASDKVPASPSKSLQKPTSISSISNGPSKSRHSKSRESNSPESSLTLSTQSSISEDETVSKSKQNDASRTSADETSLPTDRSGRIPSPSSKQENEEAKSFLIRALAPVTNLFKSRQTDSSENSRWPDSTTESTGKDVSNLVTESDRSSKSKNIVASNDDHLVQLKGIRPLDSGEKAWWLESDSDKKSISNGNENSRATPDNNIPRQIRHQESGERAWWMDSNSENHGSNQTQPVSTTDSPSSNKPFKKCKFVDEEKPWWLDSCANIPEGVERLSPPRKSSSDSDKSDKYNFFKVRRIESGEQKDWWATSNENSSNSAKIDSQPLTKSGSQLSRSGSQSLSKSGSDRNFPMRRIRHIESGERPWWLSSNKNIPEGIEKLPTPPPQDESDSSDSEEVQVYSIPAHIPPFPLHLPDEEPLGARRSPEGLETPKENEYYGDRNSPYENNGHFRRGSAEKFISRYTDIDDILGPSSQIYSPFMDSILARHDQTQYGDDECEEIDPTQVRIHDSTAQRPVLMKIGSRSDIVEYTDNQLDDTTLQVFKDGDYGPYLDLDSTLGEQEEELEGLQDGRKTALVLRTQLSVRVHAIIERLLQSEGRELRRALSTLKQILQSDKDLVHEFVANKGLDCLMQVGNVADHHILEHILRALGQILLYVDGMHGVMDHKVCIQWLYSLISSKFRTIVKTAFKLLLVFVEYTEKNSLLLIDAIISVDCLISRPPWYSVMKILKDFDASDTELLKYATTLINGCLNNVPDRDTYYDQVDSLQDQGMDDIIQFYMSKQGTDLDFLRQLQIFEAVLKYEDGDDNGTALKQLDNSVINSIRRRSLINNTAERRKSKKAHKKEMAKLPANTVPEPEIKPLVVRTPFLPPIIDNNKENKELNTALRRRRDRFARQAAQIQQQELLNNSTNNLYTGVYGNSNGIATNGGYTNGTYTSTKPYTNAQGVVNAVNNYTNGANGGNRINGTSGINGISAGNGLNGINKKNVAVNGNQEREEESEKFVNRTAKTLNLADVLKNGNQRYTSGLKQRIQNGTLGHTVSAVDAITVMRQKQQDVVEASREDLGLILNREHSIKDLAQRLTSPVSPTTEEKPLRVSDMAGIVSKAKKELAKSQSKEVIKSPSIEKSTKIHEIKVSENDLHWEELRKKCLGREFHLCDLDFSNLKEDSDDDITSPAVNMVNGPPPPPPGFFPFNSPPLPNTAPPFPKSVPLPPRNLSSELSNDSDSSTIKKNKKTVKLFWKEIQEIPAQARVMPKVEGCIWDELPDVSLDTAMLEHLFESRTNDLIIKKLMEPKRNLILDTKRSNAINIAMKRLPTPQTIKAAIMKMDATVLGREGIEKLLTMLPTEEEKVKIQEAQYANPDLPLGSAEQFLLTLASITELPSRLKLWVFKLDFDNLEREAAEPLMDLMQGIELLKVNKTFKVILSTLRSVGSFLNGSQVKGFRLEYLSKVMEVKDTVHKHPLLYHICEMIIEKFPDTTDFFSEVGPVIRASKVDFDNLTANLEKLEYDCKASWDHMKRVAKHDGSQGFKTKINEFLMDAGERIILLSLIKNRVMNRYHKFLVFLGVPPHDICKTKPSGFLKVIAEFALEYRTTRERVLQQLEKRANHRERNKTRGKMIIDVGNYSAKNGDHTADRALKELLKTDPYDSLCKGRKKSHDSLSNSTKNSTNTMFVIGDLSADDEIIKSLVRSTATQRSEAPRQRKRNRVSDKKNYNRRTLDGNNQA